MRIVRSLWIALSILTVGVVSLLPSAAAALPCCSAPICEILHMCHNGCLACALGDDDTAAVQPSADEVDVLEDPVVGVCYLAEPQHAGPMW